MRNRTGSMMNKCLLRQARGLILLLVALPLVGINTGPYRVGAISTDVEHESASPTTTATMLAGTFQIVNTGVGDQVDPHVACDLVSYTVDDLVMPLVIRYFDFATNTDHLIPAIGASHLSDVSGSRIVFTNVTAVGGNQTAIFDTVTQTLFTVPGGNRRVNSAIGGDTVAFEDRSFSTNSNKSEIVVYDLGVGTTTRLTEDELMDINPAVSPAGNAIVFQKCQTTGFDCDIYSSVQTAPGVFTTLQLTGEGGDERSPDTDGQLVVYTSTREGETDVYFQPVGGGAETQLSIPGNQRFPNVFGNLISFESQVGTQYDIFVYNIQNGDL